MSAVSEHSKAEVRAFTSLFDPRDSRLGLNERVGHLLDLGIGIEDWHIDRLL